MLAAQAPSARRPLEPALRDSILLITILVAFLEATALLIGAGTYRLTSRPFYAPRLGKGFTSQTGWTAGQACAGQRGCGVQHHHLRQRSQGISRAPAPRRYGDLFPWVGEKREEWKSRAKIKDVVNNSE